MSGLWHRHRSIALSGLGRAWDITAKILERLRQKTEAAGSGLLVFYINEKVEIYNREWELFLETYKLDGESFSPEIPRQRLAGICADLDLPFFDPTEKFMAAAEADTSRKLYFELDWHWNKYGHALVGEILTEEVGCP